MDSQSLYPMNICYRYFDLEGFFASCARLGLRSAELWLCPQHVLVNGQFSEGPERLLRLMDVYGVRLACLCGEQNNPKPNNIAARGELLVSNTRSYFEKVIDLAQATSCPKVIQDLQRAIRETEWLTVTAYTRCGALTLLPSHRL